MIQFTNIKKRFGRQEVLHKVNLAFEKPGVYAILGPNGSGKTTLIKALMGMVHPSEGEISFNGQKRKGNDYRRDIAYLPQIARFPENLRVNEFLDFIENIRGKATRRKQLVDMFGLETFLEKRLRTLSGGTRQKVNLTGALMYDTHVVILDEPTIGLDPVTLLALKDWIRMEREAGKIILLVTHILDVVQELADEIVFLLEGSVYYNGPLELLLNRTSTKDIEHAIANLLTLKKAS